MSEKVRSYNEGVKRMGIYTHMHTHKHTHTQMIEYNPIYNTMKALFAT